MITESAAKSQAAQNKTDVVVDALTTPTEQTVAHPDGTFSRTVTSEPTRMKTDAGWQEISTDLVQANVNGQSVLKPKMTPVDVTLARGGSTQMASVDDRRGHAVKQSWPFGALPEPVVSGNTATYASVLPGVDLIQVSHKTGASQVLKIANAEAAKDPRVAQMRVLLDAQNVTVQAETGGGLAAKGNDSGKAELRTAAGQWWDSSQPGASATDPGGPGITRPFSLRLGSENGKQTQILGMDEILKSPKLQYPLYVDPDWSAANASYMYVDSVYPNTSYWNGQYTDSTVHVGYLPASWAPDGASHVTRGFFQFVTQPIVGKVILGARVNVTETWSSSCTATPVSAYVTGGIGTGTTWNAQPSWMQKTSTNTIARGYSASCPAATVGFDMGTTTSWLTNSPQWTVGLRADNEGDPLGWKRFSNSASIIVTYDTPPATPNIWTISNALWTGTPFASTFVTRDRQPVYQVHDSDPDGDAGGPIQVWFSVFKSSGQLMFTTSTPVTTAGSGGYPSWQGGTLPDGTYQLQAQSKDQQGQTSGVMQFNFTVDTTAPAPPTIVPPSSITTDPGANTGADNNGTIGVTPYAFTLNNNGPYAAKGFVYAVTNTATTPTFPGIVTCGTRFGEFVVSCPSGGRTLPVTIGAIDEQTKLTVWSFDYAGNVNQQVNSAPVSYTFRLKKPDAPPTAVLQATARGGASWVDIETNSQTPASTGSCQGSVDPSSLPETSKALQLTAAGQYADTVGAAVDTARSFSVSGWFCPTKPTGSTYQGLITQMAGAGSPGGALRLNASGLAEFDTWSAANSGGQESVQRPPALAANTWSFISAVYDKNNQQLRLTVTASGFTETWTTATSTTTHLSAPTTQPVLLGAGGSGGLGQFTGQILHPVMTQAVLTTTQFADAQYRFTSADTGVLK